MSLLGSLTARIRQHSDRDWTVQEFRTVMARYGRARHVQPAPPDPAPDTGPVPETPIAFLWPWRR